MVQVLRGQVGEGEAVAACCGGVFMMLPVGVSAS